MILFRILLLFFAIEASASLIERHLHPVLNKPDKCAIRNIDYIYMINLDERPEKYKASMNALSPYEITPCRFSAVNGWKLKFEALNDLGVIFHVGMNEGPLCSVFRQENGVEYNSFEIMKEPGISYYSHSLTRGAIGCILSHLSVLQDAMDSGYQTIWIMEDDIRILSNPHQLSSFIEALDQVAPDWDILFTDNEIKAADGNPSYCRGILPRPLVPLQSLQYYLQRYDVHPEIYKLGLRFGSHSMIIRRSGIVKILDFFKKYKLFFLRKPSKI